MISDPKALADAAERLLEDARKMAPDAEISIAVSAQREAHTRFARSEITSAGDGEDGYVGLSVAFGHREAAASTNQTDPDSLRSLVDKTVRLARLAPEDPERMPVLGPQSYSAPAGTLWDEPTARLTTAVRADAIASALSAADTAKLELAGFYTHGWQHSVQLNSAGLRTSSSTTNAEFSCTARTADGTGSGWAQAEANQASALRTAELTAIALDKATRSASPKKLEAGRYTVILEPAAVQSLLGFFVNSLDARGAEEGRSFFSKPRGKTRLGERLFPKSVSIVCDPFDPQLPALPFDGEGQPRKRTVLVDRGMLRFLRRSRYWASQTKSPATGDPGPWQLMPGSSSSSELVSQTERGLLVTRFWYLRWLDPNTLTVTGLTRDGVFLVEGGQVVGPVNNFRFNHSPVTLLANVEALGSESVRVNGARVPSLRSRDFLMASVSDAV